MSLKLTVVLAFISICAFYKNSNGAFVKLTNVHCESFNKTWVVVNECRLRAIKRNVAYLNLNITFRYPAYKIMLHFNVLKKANGYKPFVMKSTGDACQYLIKKNDPIGNYIYKFYRSFSNINHTCPFVGDQIIKDFNPNVLDIMKIVLPNGEYLLMFTWSLSKKKTFVTNIYLTFNS